MASALKKVSLRYLPHNTCCSSAVPRKQLSPPTRVGFPQRACQASRLWGQSFVAPRPTHVVSSRSESFIMRASGDKETASLDVPAVCPQDDFLSSSSTTAIALAFFATGALSLFSSQCLVESVLQAYLCGKRFEEIQMELKLSTLSSGFPLMSESDIDMLSAWVALIFLTLEEIGVRGLDAAEAPGGIKNKEASEEQQRYLMGMRGYLKQTLEMYDNGYTLERLLGLQNLMQQNQGQTMMAGPSIMQHLSRLVMLTLEVVAALNLPTTKKLPNPVAVTAPTGYTLTFKPGGKPCPVITRGLQLDDKMQKEQEMKAAQANAAKPSRGIAVRILISFMGAALGSEYAMQRFAEAVFVAYRDGWSAGSVFSRLQDSDFDLAGGLLPVGGSPKPGEVLRPSDSSGDPGRNDTNKQLFATWLSATYMVYAQQGMPHSYIASEPKVGWAWAGVGQADDAAGLDRFVRGVLNQMTEDAWKASKMADGTREGRSEGSRDADAGLASGLQDLASKDLFSQKPAAESLESAESQAPAELSALAESSAPTESQAPAESPVPAETEAAREDSEMPEMLEIPSRPSFVKIEDSSLLFNSSAMRVFELQVVLIRRAYQLSERYAKVMSTSAT